MSDSISPGERVSAAASSTSSKLPPARVRTRSQPAIAASQAAAGETATTVTENYPVGYCRPPEATQFKPGRSGNPRGRPKGSKCLKTLIRENLTEKVPVRTGSGQRKMSRIEALIHKLVQQGMNGNSRAIAELMKFYASAVPEEKCAVGTSIQGDLTAADIAVLNAFRQQILGEGSQQ